MPPAFEIPGQQRPPKCSLHSMVPMGYKWIQAQDGEHVLALIKAVCLGPCGAVVTFDHPTAPSKKIDLNSGDPEK